MGLKRDVSTIIHLFLCFRKQLGGYFLWSMSGPVENPNLARNLSSSTKRRVRKRRRSGAKDGSITEQPITTRDTNCLQAADDHLNIIGSGQEQSDLLGGGGDCHIKLCNQDANSHDALWVTCEFGGLFKLGVCGQFPAASSLPPLSNKGPAS